jgi:hypothetical protein
MQRRAVLVIGLFMLAAACSSSKKAQPPATTTTSLAPTTTTTTGGSVPGTTPGTTTPTTPTTPPSSGSDIRVTGLKGPSSPVSCNAQVQLIEVSWTTSGASKVELRIDGGNPYHYSNGSHTETLPLICDGKSHVYELTATGPGNTVSQSITLQSTKA